MPGLSPEIAARLAARAKAAKTIVEQQAPTPEPTPAPEPEPAPAPEPTPEPATEKPLVCPSSMDPQLFAALSPQLQAKIVEQYATEVAGHTKINPPEQTQGLVASVAAPEAEEPEPPAPKGRRRKAAQDEPQPTPATASAVAAVVDPDILKALGAIAAVAGEIKAATFQRASDAQALTEAVRACSASIDALRDFAQSALEAWLAGSE